MRGFQRIVVAGEASLVEKAAVEELRRYADRICGTELPVMKANAYAFAKTSGPSFYVGSGA